MARLSRLLAPESIAIIGGGAWGAAIIGAAQRVGFQGQIALIHPKGKVLEGAQTFASLSDVPWPIDAAFIAVNRRATVGIVQELSALGAGGAVCFASGFSEASAEDAEGDALQDHLVAAAGDMPILGPNCYGFLNAVDGAGIWPDQHGMKPVARGVAILTQSSNIAINLTQHNRALPIAYMVACGNQAQTSQADLALALLEDDRVTAIGLHIEGFGDLQTWHQVALKARDKGVPVVALKSGKSEQAQRATVSHTASLAGGHAGARALLRRCGFGQVEDVPTFLETLRMLHVCGPLRSNAISSISCSGGEASLSADQAHDLRLELPPLTDIQKTELRAALGPMVALANPLDYHTYIWRDVDAMTAAWRPMAADHVGLTFSIVDYPRTDASDWDCATQAALNVRSESGRPFAVAATLPELMPVEVAERLMDGGVLPMFGLTECLAAAEVASHISPAVEEPPLSAPAEVANVSLIDEAAAKKALSEYGVQVPAAYGVAGGADLPKGTGPFAVKGVGLAHKSDAGAVRLGVLPDDMPEVIAAMPTERVLIEEMISDGLVELLIGVTRDPPHGFVLTLGAGGVLTEIMQDSVSLIVPAARAEVETALETLRIAPVLHGFRGKPAAAMGALLDAVMSVQAYVKDHCASLDEIEINPLIVTPTRAVAVDALIRKGVPSTPERRRKT